MHQNSTPYFTPVLATELDSTSSDTYDLLASLVTIGFYVIEAQSCSSGTAKSNEVGIFTIAITPGE